MSSFSHKNDVFLFVFNFFVCFIFAVNIVQKNCREKIKIFKVFVMLVKHFIVLMAFADVSINFELRKRNFSMKSSGKGAWDHSHQSVS